MAEPGDDGLPERIRQGLAALLAGDPTRAVGWLRPVATDAAFAAAEDLTDIRARVLSLLGQAEIERGRPDLAERPLRDAAILAKRLGDAEGLLEIRALQARSLAASADAHTKSTEDAERRRIADTSLATLLAAAASDAERAAVKVAKANAEADAGRSEEAAALATEAVQDAIAAGSVREEVLARLTLARCAPSRAEVELLAALSAAEQHAEFALVGAVARAASLAGVALPGQVGPDLGARR